MGGVRRIWFGQSGRRNVGARYAVAETITLVNDAQLLTHEAAYHPPVLATVLVGPRSVVLIGTHVLGTEQEAPIRQWAAALIAAGVPGFYVQT